jgi:hypothetical protein
MRPFACTGWFMDDNAPNALHSQTHSSDTSANTSVRMPQECEDAVQSTDQIVGIHNFIRCIHHQPHTLPTLNAVEMKTNIKDGHPLVPWRDEPYFHQLPYITLGMTVVVTRTHDEHKAVTSGSYGEITKVHYDDDGSVKAVTVRLYTNARPYKIPRTSKQTAWCNGHEYYKRTFPLAIPSLQRLPPEACSTSCLPPLVTPTTTNIMPPTQLHQILQQIIRFEKQAYVGAT